MRQRPSVYAPDNVTSYRARGCQRTSPEKRQTVRKDLVLTSVYCMSSLAHGGERGIRTLGTLARSTVFETAPFDHSGTSPSGLM